MLPANPDISARRDVLAVTEEELRQETRWPVHVVPTVDALHQAFVDTFVALLEAHNQEGCPTSAALPVGPFDYRLLARALDAAAVDCRQLTVFGLDEFCQDDGTPVPLSHPWSLRAFLETELCERLAPERRLRPVGAGRIYPDAPGLERYRAALAAHDPLDAVFFGFGINGHVGMNEPPEPGEQGATGDAGAYAALPARLVRLSRETLTQLAMGGAAGDLAGVPLQGVTLGMAEVLRARQLHIYLMRTWQPAVARRSLYGPVTPACPASFVQTHPNVTVTLVSYVAAQPWFNATQQP